MPRTYAQPTLPAPPQQHGHADDRDDDDPVDRDGFTTRKIERSQCHKRLRPPHRHQCARDPSNQSKDSTFDEHGPRYRQAVCTERARDRKLLLALRRPRQQHRGQVHHQHQQEKCAGGAQHDESGPDISDEIRLEPDRARFSQYVIPTEDDRCPRELLSC